MFYFYVVPWTQTAVGYRDPPARLCTDNSKTVGYTWARLAQGRGEGKPRDAYAQQWARADEDDLIPYNKLPIFIRLTENNIKLNKVKTTCG